jgi:putative N-acetylmannosamine-6-phosphate epimerase
VNKSISLPLGIIEKVIDRTEEYNTTFSEELTTLVRLGLRFIEAQRTAEEEKIKKEAEERIKELNKGGESSRMR